MSDYFYITKDDAAYLLRLLEGREVIDEEDSVILSPSTVTEIFRMEIMDRLGEFSGVDNE